MHVKRSTKVHVYKNKARGLQAGNLWIYTLVSRTGGKSGFFQGLLLLLVFASDIQANKLLHEACHSGPGSLRLRRFP